MWSYTNELYNYYIESQADPRVKGFALMDSPRTPLILVALYLIFVKLIGPAYMKNKKPLEINKFVTAYNAFQTIYSASVFYVGVWVWWNLGVNILCQPNDHNRTDYYSLWSVNQSWWFIIGRFIEFTDTIIFILRKKNHQATTLHVVHHAMVPLICWMGVKVNPGGHYAFAGIVNAFVHSFMYFYYMLASMGPSYRKYLWWKRYMTMMQLAQFVLVFVHTVWTLASGCNVPKVFGYMILLQAMFFYKLFWDFYKGAFKGHKQNDTNKVNVISTFNFDKYFKKYKVFFEMCIPNQEELYDHDATSPDKNIYLVKENSARKSNKLHAQ